MSEESIQVRVTRTTLKQLLELLRKTAHQQAEEYTEEKEQLIMNNM